MQYGLRIRGQFIFYVEAIVGADNTASRRVAEQILSMPPEAITERISGLPALRYLRRVEG
jgi:hypothetical protein